MSLQQNLVLMEHAREAYWRKHSGTSELKLRWRAIAVRHCFHVLPGESILEIGAGGGSWTEHIARVLRYENPITAAIFNEDLANDPRWQTIKNVAPTLTASLTQYPDASFDCIVGNSILCHDEYPQTLQSLF